MSVKWRSGPRSANAATPIYSGSFTQVGTRYSDGTTRFRERPRTVPPATKDDRGALSALHGVLSVEEAVPLIYGRGRRLEKFAVRYFDIEKLVEAGFRTHLAPSRDNPLHATISAPGWLPGDSGWWLSPPGGTLEELCEHEL